MENVSALLKGMTATLATIELIQLQVDLINQRLDALENKHPNPPADDDLIDMTHYLGEHPPHLPTDGKAETTQ